MSELEDLLSEASSVDKDGVIRDSFGRQIGSIDSDGRVKDMCHNTLGTTDGYGNCTDMNHNQVTWGDGSGYVRDIHHYQVSRPEGLAYKVGRDDGSSYSDSSNYGDSLYSSGSRSCGRRSFWSSPVGLFIIFIAGFYLIAMAYNGIMWLINNL